MRRESCDDMADIRYSAWEQLRAAAQGPAWASGLLSLDVEQRVQACAAAASLALVEALSVPDYVPEEISEAIDVLHYPNTERMTELEATLLAYTVRS